MVIKWTSVLVWMVITWCGFLLTGAVEKNKIMKPKIKMSMAWWIKKKNGRKEERDESEEEIVGRWKEGSRVSSK